ncbi:MAG: hypothetical protein AAF637_03110 [Pseudomonadota bacterium]
MAMTQEAIDEIVDMIRAGAQIRRDRARDQIVDQYKSLVAMPKNERLEETRRRVDVAVAYIHNNVPACDPDNAKISNDRMLSTIKAHYPNEEVSDEDIVQITQRAKRLVDEDLHQEVRTIMAQSKGGGEKHASRVRVDV